MGVDTLFIIRGASAKSRSDCDSDEYASWYANPPNLTPAGGLALPPNRPMPPMPIVPALANVEGLPFDSIPRPWYVAGLPCGPPKTSPALTDPTDPIIRTTSSSSMSEMLSADGLWWLLSRLEFFCTEADVRGSVSNDWGGKVNEEEEKEEVEEETGKGGYTYWQETRRTGCVVLCENKHACKAETESGEW